MDCIDCLVMMVDGDGDLNNGLDDDDGDGWMMVVTVILAIYFFRQPPSPERR